MASTAFAACGGGKQSSTTTAQPSPGASPYATSPMPASKTNAKMGKPGAMSSAASLQAGGKVYSTNCSTCHQATGKGQPGAFPPLAGNAVVTGPADKVIHIVKNGLTGKISVNGATYNGQMPAWKGTLNDNDIAAVITYIRGSWGNKAGAVTPAQVKSTK
jgi:mono/diheme cytochrome c family protein